MINISVKEMDDMLFVLEEGDEALLFYGEQEQEEFDIMFRLDIESLSNKDCVKMFHFDKDDIWLLHELLRCPEQWQGYNGTVAHGIEGICILLRRLSYPNRWCELKSVFGRKEPEMSIIYTEVQNHTFDTFDHLVTSLDQPWLTAPFLHQYAHVINAKGAPLTHCFGFVDGTVRAMCRPIHHQREVYNGHKRCHGVKFQSIMA